MQVTPLARDTADGAPPHAGPLAGIRVLELAGIGPGPYGLMLLADLGADVVRVDRPGGHAGNPVPPSADLLNRNRRSIELDLKRSDDQAIVRRLVQWSDAVVECFRPGVAERLSVGPKDCLAIKPQLVYGRMTGWGQDGPLAQRAGHDINYISIAGALHPIGPAEHSVIPMNLIGDFGGGGTFLALGILAAILHARTTGQGQVVDAAIVDGTASLTTMLHVWRAAGIWTDQRAANMLDGGAHFYRVYETADGRQLSVGAVEPQFYREFIEGLGVDPSDEWLTAHTDQRRWPSMTKKIAAIVAGKTLDEWITIFDGTDACVTPVLTPDEAIKHVQPQLATLL